MKVVQINHFCGEGSTGKICVGIGELLSENNVENYILFSSGSSTYPFSYKSSHKWYIKVQALKSRIFGNYGFNSLIATLKIIIKLNKIHPDIVHLHNIHGHDINFGLFFEYAIKRNIKIIYTFHDCWAFTGYCTHFSLIKCNGYKNKCLRCPIKKQYSWFFDNSSKLQMKKCDLIRKSNATIVTPSAWLSRIVNESLLKGVPTKIINNGIDLSIFKPRFSNFRTNNMISDDTIILLGVSFSWDFKKGLDVFIKLSKELPSKYQIVLVGTNDIVDKQVTKNIITIHKIKNQVELAEVYSAADLFVNPTREDNFPTVNIEALACGTPVITFNTGGSGEMINDSCGSVVPFDDYKEMKREIIAFGNKNKFKREMCVRHASNFDQKDKFLEYYILYKNILQYK